ncbi:Gfo/Idh/MocA family protein [Phycisphaerales bacterium AB-hyl4]|uniref:Gfo/Idh/MocA family protein n=1 Tax=Natronomicrosphaera hydrolytica TaxID=3242702 RepID=A0ABV4U868_9BACT
MVNVGVIGLGMMGGTHLDVYAKHPSANVVAISDANPDRLSGKEKAAGNIEGQAKGGIDYSAMKKYADGMELIADPDVALVDICLPTPMHRKFAEAAFAAGKHVMIEKPLANTAADAKAIADAAAKAKGLAMVGMCMRFWPGWDWLKQAIDEQTYGKVLAAHFRRVTSHPGGPFYSDGKASGGAILDLHVHDTDFVYYCFGMPSAVYSRGYTTVTGQPDHVVTQYIYGDPAKGEGPMATAEGGWALAEGFGFSMQFTVNFEKATVVFDIGASDPVTLHKGGKSEPVKVAAGMGYEHEIAYLLDCIENNRKPERVTVADAAESLKIVEAERKSIATGQVTPIG